MDPWKAEMNAPLSSVSRFERYAVTALGRKGVIADWHVDARNGGWEVRIRSR